MGGEVSTDYALLNLSGPGAGAVARVVWRWKERAAVETVPGADGSVLLSQVGETGEGLGPVLLEMAAGAEAQGWWAEAEWDIDGQVLVVGRVSAGVGLSWEVAACMEGPQTLLLHLDEAAVRCETVLLAGTGGELARGVVEDLLSGGRRYQTGAAASVRMLESGEEGIRRESRWVLMRRGEEKGVAVEVEETRDERGLTAMESVLSVLGREAGVVDEVVVWSECGTMRWPDLDGETALVEGQDLREVVRAALEVTGSRLEGLAAGARIVVDAPMGWEAAGWSEEKVVRLEGKLRATARAAAVAERVRRWLGRQMKELAAGGGAGEVLPENKTSERVEAWMREHWGNGPVSLVERGGALERMEGDLEAADGRLVESATALEEILKETGKPDESRVERILAAAEALGFDAGQAWGAVEDGGRERSVEEWLGELVEMMESGTLAGALAAVVGETRPDVRVEAARPESPSGVAGWQAASRSLLARVGLYEEEGWMRMDRGAWGRFRVSEASLGRPLLGRTATPWLDLRVRKEARMRAESAAGVVFQGRGELEKARQEWSDALREAGKEKVLEFALGKTGGALLERILDSSGRALEAVTSLLEKKPEVVSNHRDFNSQMRGFQWKQKKEAEVGPDEVVEGGPDAEGRVKVNRKEWDALKEKAAPGTSRHHYGCEFDLWTIDNSLFRQRDKEEALGYEFLSRYGLLFGWYQPYTESRIRRERSWPTYRAVEGVLEVVEAEDVVEGVKGYLEECWHWSYWPVGEALRQWVEENQAEVNAELNRSWDYCLADWTWGRKHHGYKISRQSWPDYCFNIATGPEWVVSMED